MSNSTNRTIPEFSNSENHIRCDVKNCAYHTENNCCDAGTVHVQSCTSNDCCTDQDQTSCSTFRQKR